MDKALACYPGSRGSNLDTTKDFSGPVFLGTSTMCTLSLSQYLSSCAPALIFVTAEVKN